MLCGFCGFSKRQEKEKKKIARGKKLFLKTKQQKKQEFLTTTTTTTTTPPPTPPTEKFLFRIFHRILLVRKKERKMHFQVVNCPSQVYTITTIFLSFSLCSFFVLLSLSSAFCVRRLVFVFVFVRELNRKRNWKRCRSRSRTFSL